MPRRRVWYNCLLLILTLLIVASCADKERKLPKYNLSAIAPVDLSQSYSNSKWRNNLKYLYQPLPKPLKDPKIIINKKKRILYLFSGETLMRIYPINLGPDPLRDKVKQGDGRTPEGKFFVCNKNPKSKYFKSLGISYPTKEDALRGLKSGLITKKQYKAIIWAIDHGKRPPWFTKLGGAVCIHGGGIGWDWTRGCIALRNQDMQELFEVTPLGAPVIIISGLPKKPKKEQHNFTSPILTTSSHTDSSSKRLD